MAIPSLIVALVAIAAIGIEFGIWAFIVGLSITGWADTAQVIREKTRAVKREQFVEAGHSVGATHIQILFGHVLRHVMPMVWMLLSFEISSTLMVTASLGFLGYFIGGDVWIVIGDFVARRISGAPELGQMLATSFTNILEPYGMFAVGSVIFIAVFGFNMMGEGLRRRLAYQRDVKQSIYGYILSKVIPYIRHTWIDPVIRWSARHPFWAGSCTLVVITLLTSLIVWRVQAAAVEVVNVEMPHHIWASEWHDRYGSMHTTAHGPEIPDILWIYETQGPIKGGVAINNDGILYVGDSSGTLYAIGDDGNVLWEYTIPNAIIGSPAIGEAGFIYISDNQASIYAFSPIGELQWIYTPEIERKPTNGPVVGPNDVIYSGFGSNLMAVSHNGELLWHLPIPYGQYQSPPRISVDGQWIFHDAIIADTASGNLIEWPTMLEMDIALTGLNGRHYARSGNLIMEWQEVDGDIEILDSAQWDSSAFTFLSPRYSGITPDGIIWLTYIAQRNPAVVWMDTKGNVINVENTDRIERPILIGLDVNDTAYVCGSKPVGTAMCFALGKETNGPLWSVEISPESSHQVIGGAIAPNRLYITLTEGQLIALGK
jgi:hypothetical protein